MKLMVHLVTKRISKPERMQSKEMNKRMLNRYKLVDCKILSKDLWKAVENVMGAAIIELVKT